MISSAAICKANYLYLQQICKNFLGKMVNLEIVGRGKWKMGWEVATTRKLTCIIKVLTQLFFHLQYTEVAFLTSHFSGRFAAICKHKMRERLGKNKKSHNFCMVWPRKIKFRFIACKEDAVLYFYASILTLEVLLGLLTLSRTKRFQVPTSVIIFSTKISKSLFPETLFLNTNSADLAMREMIYDACPPWKKYVK